MSSGSLSGERIANTIEHKILTYSIYGASSYSSEGFAQRVPLTSFLMPTHLVFRPKAWCCQGQPHQGNLRRRRRPLSGRASTQLQAQIKFVLIQSNSGHATILLIGCDDFNAASLACFVQSVGMKAWQCQGLGHFQN